MKGSYKPLPNGIWRCQHPEYKQYCVVYIVTGSRATVIKSSKASGFPVGKSTINSNWSGSILTRWSTKHYYKLL